MILDAKGNRKKNIPGDRTICALAIFIVLTAVGIRVINISIPSPSVN